MNIKKLYIIVCFLILAGCGGTILDESELETNSIQIQGVSVTSASATASVIWTTDVSSTHRIEYGTASGNYTLSTTESSEESTTHQVDFSGLVTDQVYYFKIICSADGYESIESAEFSFTTSSTIVVSSLTAGTLTTNSATITWTTGVDTTHIVEYGTTAGSYTQTTIQSSVPSMSHSVTLSGLASGTEYFYRVKNFHSTLPFTTSTELSFITTGVITVSGITESSDTSTITIGWTTNLPTTHSIDYGTSSGSYTLSTVQSAVPAMGHSVTITGLTKGTTYYYRINNTHTTLGTVLSGERSYSTTPTLVQKLRGIWIIGGISNQNIASTVSSIDLFDPVTQIWYDGVATLQTPVSFAASASYGGKIYIIGGFNSAGTALGIVQRYDVASNTWLPVGNSMAAARANINAVTVNSKIYVMGGTSSNASIAYAGSNTTYEYIPDSTWSTKTVFNATTTIADRGMVAFDDVIYNIGGRSGAAVPIVVTNSIDGFSLSAAAGAGGITSGATEVNLTAVRTGFAAVKHTPSGAPSRIVIAGGVSAITVNTGSYVFNAALTTITPVNTLQYISYPFTAPSVWTTATNNMPTALGYGAGAEYNGVFYWFGGASTPGSFSTAVYSYNLATLPSGSWSTLTSMSTARAGHCAVKVIQ